MSFSSSSQTVPQHAQASSHAVISQHPAARLVPGWHGRYQARRGRRRSDPRLTKYLWAMAISAIVGAAVLLAFLLLQELQHSDRLHAEAASLEASVAMDRILEEVADTIEDAAPALNNVSNRPDAVTPETRRQSRREIFAKLSDSPIAGLVLVDGRGDVVLETGDAQRVNLTNRTNLPLEPYARLLDQKMTILSPETDLGLQALFMLPDGEHAAIALIDEAFLIDALAPRFDPINRVYLYDEFGRILAVSRGRDAVDEIEDQPGARLLIQHRDTKVRAGGGAMAHHGQAVSRPVSKPGLHVIAIPRTITLARFLGTMGHLLAAGIAFSLLTIGLLLYVIQAEWRKHDRRANLDEDVVARSEIAADIMGAGIIDWRVADAVVSYSEGWQRLFSEGAPTEDEEIFDWIDKLHPECKALARENYEALIEGRIFEIQHEIKVRRRDGEYVTIRERGRSRLNASGAATRVVLVQRLSRGQS